MRKEVPFYANAEDGTHCFQACLRMLLKYYLPERDFTWQELDVISAKAEGLWTWPTAALLWLSENGFAVHNVETFNYEDFAYHGSEYLLNYFGSQVGQEQIDHSDISQEMRFAQTFTQKISSEVRIPGIIDLQQSLDSGRLPCCNINSRRLNDKDGYSGHFVVVTGYDDDALILHDPGLPPQKNRIVSKELFEQAWAYPSDKAKNFFCNQTGIVIPVIGSREVLIGLPKKTTEPSAFGCFLLYENCWTRMNISKGASDTFAVTQWRVLSPKNSCERSGCAALCCFASHGEMFGSYIPSFRLHAAGK